MKPKVYSRIQIFGAPAVGKSTVAAYIYSVMKEKQYSVELVTEFVKSWVYEKRVPQSLDQLYILAQQQHAEDTFLSHGVANIITDSPVLLTAIYAGYNGDPALGEELTHICRFIEKKYPSLNLILERDPEQFQQEGRYHNMEQTKELDTIIRDAVYRHCPYDSIFVIPAKNRKELIMDVVLKHAKKSVI